MRRRRDVVCEWQGYRRFGPPLYCAPDIMANDPLLPAAIEAIGGAMEFPVGAQAAEALARFGRLFLRWNESINLASLRSPSELAERHFVDAFAACRAVGATERVADVGTGGGLPAIPMAILLPGCQFDLFEPIRKKVAFLRTAVREAGLSSRVFVHPMAITRPIDPAFQHQFDVASSRATLAPPEWLALGKELVKEGGRVIVFTTGQASSGLPEPIETREYGENRRLLVFQRSGQGA